jgi:anti-sigma B factor antagonist
VVLRGELDLGSVPDLRACFEGVLATSASVVHVDLAAVSFIDSSALGVLIDAFRQLRDRDGHLVVTAASPSVMRVLDILGLASYFRPAGADGSTPVPD